jgi:hypothetical protein
MESDSENGSLSSFSCRAHDRTWALDYEQRFINKRLDHVKLAAFSASELITKYYKYGRAEGYAANGPFH